MHRVILDAPAWRGVDHVNGNGLDNRRANLRFADQTFNQANARRGRSSTSRYKGVTLVKKSGRWLAQTTRNGKTVFLGYHDTEEAAALAYDAYAREAFGEFACLNFPKADR